MSKGENNLLTAIQEAGLPRPARYAYFPPAQIFGRVLVPVYYSGTRPVIPLSFIAQAVGVSFNKAFSIINFHREALDIFDASTRELVPPSASLQSLKNRLCLGTDGICALVLSLDHNRADGDGARERLIAAKRWFLCQVANRIKISGRKNQPRWDAGLSQEQARELKKQFALVNGK